MNQLQPVQDLLRSDAYGYSEEIPEKNFEIKNLLGGTALYGRSNCEVSNYFLMSKSKNAAGPLCLFGWQGNIFIARAPRRRPAPEMHRSG